MIDDYGINLRAMLAAWNAVRAASDELRAKQKAYIDAQSAFTGKFSQNEWPLGPFVVGETLVEHRPTDESWPQQSDQFRYSKVIRCPTSE